jgi:hypothetical protein
VIDHVGYTRAFFELFEGAIYMHQVRERPSWLAMLS